MSPQSKGFRSLVVVGALLLLRPSTPASAEELQPGEYRVSSSSSGLCLDAERGSRNAGSQVQQFGCHGGLNQRLRLIPFGDSWILRAMHSELCLARRDDGTLVQEDCDGSESQFFQLSAPTGADEGDYRILGGNLCLEDRNAEAPYRVAMKACDDAGAARQTWSLW